MDTGSGHTLPHHHPTHEFGPICPRYTLTSFSPEIVRATQSVGDWTDDEALDVQRALLQVSTWLAVMGCCTVTLVPAQLGAV